MSINIRLKRDHTVVVTVDLQAVQIAYVGYGWVKGCNEDGMATFYSDAHWEPVPVERWQDVTAECVVKDDGGCASIAHDGLFIAMFKSDYRLRKEQVYFQATPGQHRAGWAFIVERRVKE
jgi:hypothetical protein